MRSVLLLPLIYCLVSGQAETLTTSTTTFTPTTPPASGTTGNSSAAKANAGDPNQAGTKGGWEQSLQNILAHIAHSGDQPSATGNNSRELLGKLLSELPGVLQGLDGVDVGENDVGEVLASLFADRRAAGIPAWIEQLIQGNATSLGQTGQALLQMLSSQSPENQTQALLSQVFSDIGKGLQSLGLDTNSSLEEIVSAVMNDPGLMTSLSTAAVQMLAALAGNPDPQELLQEVFPVDPRSQCAADLQTWASALQRQDVWAIIILDAMGKLQSGLLTGQLVLVGDYEECVDISYPDLGFPFERHMCPMAFTSPAALAPFVQNSPMAVHLCVPKSCKEEHLYGLMYPTLQALGSQHVGIQCVGPRDPDGDSLFIGVTAMLAVLAFLCAVGTAYGAILDCRRKKQTQANQPMETTGYTNNGYVANGDAPQNPPESHVNGGLSNQVASHLPSEGHVNGGLSSQVVPPLPSEGHVNGGLSNQVVPPLPSEGHVNGALPGNYMKYREDEEKVDLKDMEGGVVNGGGPVVSADDTPLGNKVSSGSSRPRSEEGLCSKVLLSFSVLRNGCRVLNCEQSQADIACLHGIRVLSITWVVLGHAFSMVNGVVGNGLSMNRAMEDFTFMAVLAGLLAVDTFFLLSGCLTSFLFLRTTKKSGLSVGGVVLYYIHRVWRLTPLYAVVLAVYVGIFPYLKEGPYQNWVGMDSENACRHYWYLNLLYVNNIINGDKMCFGWSWYLSNDMQFSFLAPLVLIPWTFTGSRKKVNVLGFLLCVGMILTHCISSGVISYTKEAFMFGGNNGVYMEDVYFPPWTRIGPYAVGLLLGYLLFVTPPKYTMDKLSVFLGWTLSTAVALTLVYVRYDNVGELMTKGPQWSFAESAAYESLDKVLWAVCVAWVIFACCKGYGGFVNTLLSWSAWAPLSRLTYGVYLIHCIVLFVLGGNMKKPLYMDTWTGTTLFLATTVLSFLLSFIFSMLVEAPTLGLEKAVLGKIFRSKK